MRGGLKQLWGLERPAPAADGETARSLRAEFEPVAEALALQLRRSAACADRARQLVFAAQREALVSRYQSLLLATKAADLAPLQPAIAQFLADARALRDEVQGFRAEAEQGLAAWLAREPEFDAAIEQVEALHDAPHPKAAAAQSLLDAIRARLDERRYAAASAALDGLAARLPALALAEAAPQAMPPLVARAGRLVQSTVTLRNETGTALRLRSSALKFDTARFVPPPPALIAARSIATFGVVENTVGAKKTAGSVRYHVERRRHDVDATFSWDGPHGDVKIDGRGPYRGRVSTSQDSELGNAYDLALVDGEAFGDDPLQQRIDLGNRSGVVLELLSAELEDPQHTEFSEQPRPRVRDTVIATFAAQALDEQHPHAAGSVVYRIGGPESPHTARLRWRRGATPVGAVDPDDGRFVVSAERRVDRVSFSVLKHDGPPPQPAGPTRVTIVNRAGFALRRGMLALDGPKARLRSEPDETIEGGRRTRFEVESTDPEFPQSDGLVSYALQLEPQADPQQIDIAHVAIFNWRDDGASSASVEPPADGVTVEVGGGRGDVVFTVNGPELGFDPPQKIKQPTLRRGDKGADGWVEYLQQALNHHLDAGLVVDGDFGPQTHRAVFAFQKLHQSEGVRVDGIVGNQTWSFLREGVPEPPKTDGRPPHSYHEKGLEARWVREQAVCRHDPAQDALVMQAVSVGDADRLQGRQVRIRIGSPQGVQRIIERPLGPPLQGSTTGQGNVHEVRVERFATLFDEDAVGGPVPGDYPVDAYFDDELGGDRFSEGVIVAGSA